MTNSFSCEPFSIIRVNAIEVLKQLRGKVDCLTSSPHYLQQHRELCAEHSPRGGMAVSGDCSKLSSFSNDLALTYSDWKIKAVLYGPNEGQIVHRFAVRT